MAVVRLLKDEFIDQIPHGEEAVEIDEVVIEKGYVKAYRHYPEGDDALNGHYGIVPGTRLLEAALQSSMFVRTEHERTITGLVMRIEKVDFVDKVVAGDTVEFTTEYITHFGNVTVYNCKARVNDYLVMRCKFTCK